MAVTVHLVRHGEVENPKGVIYGRLPGYHLSERGQRQAAAAARRLKDADLAEVWASPLERAQETAAAIAEPHGLEIVTDDRLIESGNTFEGVGKTIFHLISNPAHWWRFRNPFKPSWGESFDEIRTRMMGAVTEALARADGREVVVVSHQTPVLVARLALARRRVPPWFAFAPCETGSVTSMRLENGTVLSAAYFSTDATDS
ncbi:MAG: histidine phosphatase family protein [Actinomycetota bacterium]|nr:histidine phosphatase family protein [Actinomycetota bacterium]